MEWDVGMMQFKVTVLAPSSPLFMFQVIWWAAEVLKTA